MIISCRLQNSDCQYVLPISIRDLVEVPVARYPSSPPLLVLLFSNPDDSDENPEVLSSSSSSLGVIMGSSRIGSLSRSGISLGGARDSSAVATGPWDLELELKLCHQEMTVEAVSLVEGRVG